jgi:O-antigen/teichoic acid export membrane protein
MIIRRALAFSYLDKYASLIVYFAASVITARLLTPAEMGVFSVTMVMVGFLAPFRDLGASQFLIQQRELSVQSLRAVWTVQLVLGGVLALLIYAGRGPLAQFYREPRIEGVMVVLALNSLLMPFGATTSAWLTRNMRFDALGLIRFSGALCGSCASVVFAATGHGPISLAYGALIGTGVSAAVASFFRPAELPWLPGFSGIRQVVGFGSMATGTTLLNIAGSSAPELLLGRLQGMTATGMFGRAQGLVMMFERLVLEGVHAVALPMFSQQLRQGGDYAGAFVRAASYVTLVGWTFLGGLALLADPIILVLYGAKWRPAVSLVECLCLGMCLHMPALLSSPPLVAKGRVRLVLAITAGNTLFNVVVIAWAAHHSLATVGWTMAAAAGLTSIPLLLASQRVIGFRWAALGSELLRSGKVALSAVAAAAVLRVVDGPHQASPVLHLGLAVVLGAIAFVLALRRWHQPLWHELVQALSWAVKRLGRQSREQP